MKQEIVRVMSSHSLRLDAVYTWPFRPANKFYKITKAKVNYNFVVADLGRFDPHINKQGLIAETKLLSKSPEKETSVGISLTIWFCIFISNIVITKMFDDLILTGETMEQMSSED